MRIYIETDNQQAYDAFADELVDEMGLVVWYGMTSQLDEEDALEVFEHAKKHPAIKLEAES